MHNIDASHYSAIMMRLAPWKTGDFLSGKVRSSIRRWAEKHNSKFEVLKVQRAFPDVHNPKDKMYWIVRVVLNAEASPKAAANFFSRWGRVEYANPEGKKKGFSEGR